MQSTLSLTASKQPGGKKRGIYKFINVFSMSVLIINMSLSGVFFIAPAAVEAMACSVSNTSVYYANETIHENHVSYENRGWTSNDQYAIFNDSEDYAVYGFPNLNIPAGSTISGIEVKIEGQRNGSDATRNITAALWNTSNSSPDAYTTSKTAILSNNDTIQTLGDSTNKWGKNWTVADFADATFKIKVGATYAYGDAALDAVSIKVYYYPPCVDADGDGYYLSACGCGPADCNDSNANINSGASETCDGIDNNCNGQTDEGYNVGTTCTSGTGVCMGTGQLVCAASHDAAICNAVEGTPVAEICGDLIDQDCNGSDLTCPVCDDNDDDGICDNQDNCSTVYNPAQDDVDSDGVGNACDNCVSTSNPAQEDSDGDLVGNACDNCVNNANANQADDDQDGIGNACDPYLCIPALAHGEICNQIDDDCDGSVDEGDVCQPTCSTGPITISNGGFEAPIIDGGWQVFPSGTSGLGWNVNWVNVVESAPNPALLELQNTGVGYSGSAEGNQWAELDADYNDEAVNEKGSVNISQEVNTIEGAKYKLSFKFSARPNTDADDNNLRVQFGSIDQSVVLSSGSDTNWAEYSFEMTAGGGNITVLSFTDMGNADTYGTLLDDVRVELMECPVPTTGSLTIVKTAVDAGDMLFNFFGSLDTFSLAAGGSKTVTDIIPGQDYTIGETVPTGWSLASKDCQGTDWNNQWSQNMDGSISVNLQAGSNVTCTFTNTKNLTPVCGDGSVNQSSEQCDNGQANGSCPAACSSNCQLNQCGGSCVSGTTLLDVVLPTTLSTWGVNNTGGNPIFTAEEITSPYDLSTAIKTSVVGNTVNQCPSQSIYKTYNISGNTLTSDLQAYLAFTSTMDTYNFPYVVVTLLDDQDTSLGYQVYYGQGVISGIYAGYAAADPAHYTELPTVAGDVTLDLAKMGDINFSKIIITIANYACIGENSVIFDHLRMITDCDGEEPTGTITVCKYESVGGVCNPENSPADYAVYKNGYYWAWASPCSGGCSTVEPIKVPGWRFATEEEWEKRPVVTDFGTSDNFKCAAPYFDYTHSHCDWSDGSSGNLARVPDGQHYETWLVYDCSLITEPVLSKAGSFLNGLFGINAVNADLPGTPLSGWTINATSTGDALYSESKVTGEDGCVTFTVPYGAYRITETMKPGWHQVYPGGNGYFDVNINVEIKSAQRYFTNIYQPGCGNGALDNGEACDDGNITDADGCSANCTIEARCGDGIVNRDNEQCDAGDANGACPAACSSNCQTNSCNSSSSSSGGGGLPFCYYDGTCSTASGFSSGIIPTPGTPIVAGEEGAPKLEITKTVNKDFVNPGQADVEYTIIVKNSGNLTAFDVVVTDTMPASLVHADSKAPVYTWNTGDLAPGASKEIKFLATISKDAKPNIYTNVATAKASNAAEVTANAKIEVKSIAVLAATGFSWIEFVWLMLALLSLIGGSQLLRSQLKIKPVKSEK